MNKRDACELLGLDSIKELALAIDVKYDTLRTMRKLSPMQVKLVRWEIDKQFVKAIKENGIDLISMAKVHLNKQRKIDSILKQDIEDDKATTNGKE